MPNIGPTELVLLLVMLLVVFGPGKLPDLGKALGRGISEFRQAVNPFAPSDSKTNENQAPTGGSQ